MRRFVVKLCAFAITIATIAPNVCRGSWYQPEEPEGLKLYEKE